MIFPNNLLPILNVIYHPIKGKIDICFLHKEKLTMFGKAKGFSCREKIDVLDCKKNCNIFDISAENKFLPGATFSITKNGGNKIGFIKIKIKGFIFIFGKTIDFQNIDKENIGHFSSPALIEQIIGVIPYCKKNFPLIINGNTVGQLQVKHQLMGTTSGQLIADEKIFIKVNKLLILSGVILLLKRLSESI